MLSRLLRTSLLLLTGLLARDALGQVPATPGAWGGKMLAPYSRYERAVLGDVLETRQVQVEPDPEGKPIESVELVRLDPFDQSDPVPDFINVIHVLTREGVIRRELLFRAGEPYHQAKVDESARALRARSPLSLVVLLPIRGSQSERIRVLVVTKDVWTLVPAWNPQIASGSVSMTAAVVDTNLLGTHTALAMRGGFDARSYSLGGSFADPRLFGSHIRTTLGASAVFNRETGQPEGSYGQLTYGTPLWSLNTPWSWGASVAWRNDVQRSYVGGKLRRYDATVTEESDKIPFEWNRNVFYGDYEATRSYGKVFKVNLTAGFNIYSARYSLPANPGVDPAALQEFRQQQTPPDDQRLGPFFQMRAYRAKYLRTWDLETLALEENYQMGHDLVFRFYPVAKALGSSRDLLGTYAGAGYTIPLKDGLLRAVLSSRVELATPGPQSSDGTDALFEGQVRIASPRTPFGRIVYDGQISVRAKDYLKERFSLGGTNRLRGYPVGTARGKHLVAGTVEFRSRWVGILGTQVGLAAFYDMGDAFDQWDQLRLKQDLGVGIRVMLPQANRDVFRVDWGFPLDQPRDGFPGGISLSFYQAFPLPSAQSSRSPRALGLVAEGPPEPIE